MTLPTHVTVNADALHQVLIALLGAPHLIRELQFTRGLPIAPGQKPNPIDSLIADFNAQVQDTQPPTT